jgi:hypothetical protein
MSGSHQDAEVEIRFSPLYAILQSSMDRLLAFLKSDSFTFLVNGETLESTVAEAISISPRVFELLSANPLNQSFSITSDLIQSADFGLFLSFSRCRDLVRIPRSRILSFVSICGLLGNEQLSLALLSSLTPLSREPGTKGKGPAICEGTVEECASQFYSYSADNLRFVDRQTLHRLLSSEFLLIESEDWLLRVLLDIGVDRFEFFDHIEVSLLSSSGLSLFVEEVKFDDLSEAIWLQILSRLKGLCPESVKSRRYVKQF